MTNEQKVKFVVDHVVDYINAKIQCEVFCNGSCYQERQQLEVVLLRFLEGLDPCTHEHCRSDDGVCMMCGYDCKDVLA